MQAGTYVYELIVTDNRGATAKDQVTITVSPAANIPPVAVQSNRIITLPTDFLAVDAGASFDEDGTIAQYKWEQVSGPATAVILNANKQYTWLQQMSKTGLYVFRLTVTDDKGAAASKEFSITVLENKENHDKDSLVLYPNPVKQHLNITIQINKPESRMLLQVFNALGVLVHSEQFSGDGLFRKTVDMQKFPAGIYVVKITSPQGYAATRQIIKIESGVGL